VSALTARPAAPPTRRPAFGSTFSGIGGLDLALQRAGWDCRWQVEIDGAANRVLARRWPDVRRYGDIAAVDPAELVPVDLLCGGFPCQDLSVAGARAGLAGARSGLFHEFVRLAAGLRPRWLLIENVPGLLSSNGGRDMGTVVGALAELGYGWAYRCLDAQHFGLAQRRLRVFIVGCLGEPTRAAQVLFEPESGVWDPPPRREAGAGVAPSVTPGARRASANRAGELLAPITGSLVSNGDQHRGFRDAEGLVAGTVQNTGHGWWNESPIAQTIRTPSGQRHDESAETYAIQNDCWSRSGDAGDGVRAPGLGIAEAGEPMFTLDTVKPHAVAHALTGEGHDAGEDGTGRGTPLAVVPFDTTQVTSAGNYSSPKLGDPCHPLAAGAHAPAIAFTERSRDDGRSLEAQEELAYALTNPGEGGRAQERNIVAGMAVRRLTPRECERLQGFPDDWTAGESDSARYRLLGNAVAVPVAGWIARRMVAVL
jgi:DNA (cytosine-5)-methyltransferase 1